MKSGCFPNFCADNGHFWAMLWESDYKAVDGMQFLDKFQTNEGQGNSGKQWETVGNINFEDFEVRT